MRRVLLVLAIITSAGMLASPLRATATYTFTTFDYPDSQDTIAYGINNLGQIVGTYFGNPPDAMNHGFLLENGTFTRIDAPGGPATQALAINDGGTIVGAVGDMFGFSQSGFVKDGDVFTMVQPGASTTISGINNDGLIVGMYIDDFSSPYTRHGFYGLSAAGPFYNFDYFGGIGTALTGVNSIAAVTGTYWRPDLLVGSFVEIGGAYGTTPASVNIYCINDQLAFGGSFSDGLQHRGFVFADGVFTVVDPPGSVFTEVRGINNDGTVVGRYTESTPGGNQGHAFMATLTP